MTGLSRFSRNRSCKRYQRIRVLRDLRSSHHPYFSPPATLFQSAPIDTQRIVQRAMQRYRELPQASRSRLSLFQQAEQACRELFGRTLRQAELREALADAGIFC